MERELDKNTQLHGRFCSLVPIREQDLPAVIRLRNQEKNKYFLNQKQDITLEAQRDWFLEYQKRRDDLYLGIWSRKKEFAGTIRLYHAQRDICEEGSCIVDEKLAKEAPYAAEAKYLLMQHAFLELGIRQIINQIRTDNKVMLSLAKQQGFRFVRDTDIGGVQYCYMILDAENFDGERLKKILDYWADR